MTEPSRRTRPPMLRIVVPLLAVAAIAVAVIAGYRAGESSVGVPDGDATHLRAQPIDTGFAADMFDHHQQALQMALLVLNRDTSSAVRTLATEMITSQQREAGQLIQFLADRGLIPSGDPNRTVMAWMNEPVPKSRMPGLATQDQLTALTNAGEDDFQRQFLELMIHHHEGGVHMAEFASQHAETQQLRDLADQMILAQRHEITEMQQLLGSGG